MTTTYNYSVSGDFPNQAVATNKLHKDVNDNTIITTNLDGINLSNDSDNCDVLFTSSLSAGEKTELDSVVSGHDGVEAMGTIFHASSKFVENEAEIISVSGWQVLGGVVTNPSFFTTALPYVIGRITGSIKTTASGLELRIIEDDGTTEVSMTTPAYSHGETSGVWETFKFNTDIPPSAGENIYRLEGRLNTTTSGVIRFVSMSLLELVP